MTRLIPFLTVILFLTGCFSTSNTVTPLRTATFDYQPPESSNKRPDIAMILLKPMYGESLGALKSARVFSTMLGAMEKDFEELVTKRGYTMRGPFNTYGNINFPDKEAAPLILKVEVELQITELPNSVKAKYSPLLGTSYNFDGEIELSGRVNLIFMESMTQERIDNPSVTIPNKRFAAKSEKSYTTQVIPITDPGIYNELTKALEEVYDDLMMTAWNKLDPNEVSRYMTSVNNIRKRKGF